MSEDPLFWKDNARMKSEKSEGTITVVKHTIKPINEEEDEDAESSDNERSPLTRDPSR